MNDSLSAYFAQKRDQHMRLARAIHTLLRIDGAYSVITDRTRAFQIMEEYVFKARMANHLSVDYRRIEKAA